MKCPQCNDGKMTITVHQIGQKADSVKIDCIHCDGTGEIDQQTADLIEEEKNMWCKCDNPSEWPKHYKDGEHPDLYKHHYRCTNCDGVQQIG
jgi:hypothetical protein